jgi:hypothetical protein
MEYVWIPVHVLNNHVIKRPSNTLGKLFISEMETGEGGGVRCWCGSSVMEAGVDEKPI